MDEASGDDAFRQRSQKEVNRSDHQENIHRKSAVYTMMQMAQMEYPGGLAFVFICAIGIICGKN